MKLKKFYEFVNSVRELTLDDLSMFLRVGDMIKIKSEDGTDTYKIDNLTENDLSVVTIGEGPEIQIIFNFVDLNNKWEILEINDEEIIINESKS